MSGLLMDERFVAVFPSLVRKLGNMEAAAILQHLHWSADVTGWIHASYAQVSADTGITERTVRRRIQTLRDEGYLTARRASSTDATMVYRVEVDKVAGRCGQSGHIEGANLATSDPANLATSSTQKERTTSSIGRDVAPEVHPQRPIAPDWAPASEWFAYLRVVYPDVDLSFAHVRFVNYHLSRKDVSRSWEALFENWVGGDQQRIDETKLAGTDDLGVPLRQRASSVVGDALKPGDEGYFDASAYLERTIEEDDQRSL